MKYVFLALLLFAAGVVVGHVERESELFTPIVRIRSSDGLFITMVQPRTARQSACASALERFEETLKSTCPACAVESADCATRLEGIDLGLAAGQRLPIYTISAEGIRVGLLGPPGSVESECEAMARQFLQSGVRSAACVAPRPDDEAG